MTKKNEEWLKTLQMEEFSYLTNLLGFSYVWGLVASRESDPFGVPWR
jgi:hypothetical protein